MTEAIKSAGRQVGLDRADEVVDHKVLGGRAWRAHGDLRCRGPLVERVGPCATGAINRIFGFLILAIAVQLVWDGVADFK